MASVPTLPTFGGVLSTSQLTQLADYMEWFSKPPGARMRAGSTHSIPDTTWTPLQFDTTTFDQSPNGVAHHDNVTNNTRFTVQYSGTYLVGGVYATAANATGRRYVAVAVNGTRLLASATNVAAATAAAISIPTTAILVQATVGDYIEIHARQESGVAVSTISSFETASQFNVAWWSRG